MEKKKNSIRKRRMKKFLLAYFTFFTLYFTMFTFSKYVGVVNGNGTADVAKWEVVLNTEDNDSDVINIISGTTQSYTLKLISTSETIATYTIIISDVPSGLEVKLDEGEYETTEDGTITYDDVGYINADAETRNITHTITFNAPINSNVASTNELNIDVVFVQKEPESKYGMMNGRDFNALIEDNTTDIIFTDDVAPNGATLIDVSSSGTSSVVAWYQGTKMYISTQEQGVKVCANPDSSYMFSAEEYNSATGVTNIDFSNFDTTFATDMSYMFANALHLEELDLSGFDTSNVTNMSYMFAENNELISLDISSFNTQNVTDMSYMFMGCNELEEIDVSKFNTSNVTNMADMFQTANAIQELDIRSFDTSKVEYMAEMFIYCGRLSKIYANDTFVTTSVVDNGEEMFFACQSIEGSGGTTYSNSHTNMAYAHIDGGVGNPGYFSEQ